MKQEGKAFSPSTLVVTKGTRVDFPNRDAIFHNVFSVTPDNSFDLGSYRQGESKSVTMAKTGVVTVYCNMHPQMVGHILVVPNGNYVRAGKDGFFRLTNVPGFAGIHVARELSRDPENALEVHVREELGLDVHELPSPWTAGTASGTVVTRRSCFFATSPSFSAATCRTTSRRSNSARSRVSWFACARA